VGSVGTLGLSGLWPPSSPSSLWLSLLFLLEVVGLQLPLLAAPDPRPWTVKVFGASAPGSGVVVRSSSGGALVLTAGHVLEGTSIDDHPTVVLPDGKELPVLSIRFVEKLDLAEIRVPWPNAPFPILSVEPHAGGTVWLGGYPQDSQKFWLRRGPSDEQGRSVTARPGGYALFHGVSSTIGLSGAGLYNQRGELIAIHGEADVLRTASGKVFKSGVGLGIPIMFWNRSEAENQTDPAIAPLQDQLLQVSWLESMGRFDSALELLVQLMQQYPDDRRVQQRRVVVLLSQRNYQKAFEALEDLLRKSPEDVALLINRGNALLGLQRPLMALESYEVALAREPRLVWGHVNKAKALQALGHWEDAKISLNRAVMLAPRDPAALRERAAVFHHLGLHREALVDLDHLVELRGGDPEALSRRGLLRGELGDLSGSVEDLTAVIELQPDEPLHRLNRGASLARLQRWREASADFQIAIQRLPRHPVLLANLGEALYALGDGVKACGYAQQATRAGVDWEKGQWGKAYRNQCLPH